jgi:hypothetical protein
MIDMKFAEHFVQDWIAAWNSHDLDAILSHYHDDFEMSSPFIEVFDPDSKGTLKGKEAVGKYWSVALEKFNDLHFVLDGIFIGANSIAVSYMSVLDKKAIEVFFFDENAKLFKAAAHYF